MVVIRARRGVALLLLLTLALTACGRATPRVTAEDGRGGDGPSDTIWIPETRDVDGGPDLRADGDEDPDPDTDRPRRDRASDDEDTSRDADEPARDADEETPTAPEPTEATAPRPDPTETSVSTPRRSSQPGRGASPGSETSPAEDEAEEPETTDPQPAGDCGTSRQDHRPSREEVERATERLAEEVAERWPDTHAGVWVTDGARPEVHVAFSERAQERVATLCRTFEHPDLLRGVAVELSAEELDRKAARVTEERDALREGRPPADLPEEIRATEGRYTVEVDHPGNRLVVVVEHATSRLEAAFVERYTPRLVLDEGAVEEREEPEAESA